MATRTRRDEVYEKVLEFLNQDLKTTPTKIAQAFQAEGFLNAKGNPYTPLDIRRYYVKAIEEGKRTLAGATGEQVSETIASEAGATEEQLQDTSTTEESEAGATEEQPSKGSKKRAKREQGTKNTEQQQPVIIIPSTEEANGEQQASEAGATEEQLQDIITTKESEAGATEEQPLTSAELIQVRALLRKANPEPSQIIIPDKMPYVEPGAKSNHRIRRALLAEAKGRVEKLWGIGKVSDQDFLNALLLIVAGHREDSDELRKGEPKKAQGAKN